MLFVMFFLIDPISQLPMTGKRYQAQPGVTLVALAASTCLACSPQGVRPRRLETGKFTYCFQKQAL